MMKRDKREEERRVMIKREDEGRKEEGGRQKGKGEDAIRN